MLSKHLHNVYDFLQSVIDCLLKPCFASLLVFSLTFYVLVDGFEGEGLSHSRWHLSNLTSKVTNTFPAKQSRVWLETWPLTSTTTHMEGVFTSILNVDKSVYFAILSVHDYMVICMLLFITQHHCWSQRHMQWCENTEQDVSQTVQDNVELWGFKPKAEAFFKSLWLPITTYYINIVLIWSSLMSPSHNLESVLKHQVDCLEDSHRCHHLLVFNGSIFWFESIKL